MKKTMKKLLLSLLLGISLLNTATTSYSATMTEYTEDYGIELHSFEDEEDRNNNLGVKY